MKNLVIDPRQTHKNRLFKRIPLLRILGSAAVIALVRHGDVDLLEWDEVCYVVVVYGYQLAGVGDVFDRRIGSMVFL